MNVFNVLCSVGFLARFSYALARNPVLPLFALYLGAGPEAIGLAVGISTVTGIIFKLPSGALSDIIGRRRTLLVGLVSLRGHVPFAYLLIRDYTWLVVVRFLHGLATAIYGPVAMALVADVAGCRRRVKCSPGSLPSPLSAPCWGPRSAVCPPPGRHRAGACPGGLPVGLPGERSGRRPGPGPGTAGP